MEQQLSENLFKFEWELTHSPAGAKQWVAKDGPEIIPDAHVPGKFNKPTMLTTDLTLRFDPEFGKISKRFHENPQAFAEAFARAWFKLTHRDMGPKARYLGPEVPKEDLIWQDPLPEATHKATAADIADIKSRIAASGLSVSQLVAVAWASASTFRGGDKRGGANGARLALAPQKDWEVNRIAVQALPKLIEIQQGSGKASLADVIVLVEAAWAWNRPPRRLAWPSKCRSHRAVSTQRRRRPMSNRLPSWSPWPMASATTSKARSAPQPKPCCSTAPSC